MKNTKGSLSDHWWMDSQPSIIKKNTLAPKVSELSDREIIQLAESTATVNGYKFDGNIEDCLQKLGGNSNYTDYWMTDGAEKGSVWIQSSGKFIVWLSSRASKRVNVFTVAHEIGHYIVHYENQAIAEENKFMIAARYGNGDVERQADIFAINFLAPKRIVEKCLKMDRTIESISKELCVDEHLVSQQIKQFKLK